MAITYTIPAIGEEATVISLIDAKAQLRIEHDNEDAVISDCIDAAVAAAENYIGGPIAQRTGVIFGLNEWKNKFYFPVGPVTAVSQVAYWPLGVELSPIVLDSGQYQLYNFGPTRSMLIIRESSLGLPLDPERLDAVEITTTVGWAVADIPKEIRQAMLLLVDDFYTYRGDRPLKDNRSAMNLLRAYRNG